ncbi:hypothetical protein HYH02_002009 [Chlamydomonas schloesseri]|uniref:Carbonic anhydrase n=1 Tax=Chlamydomonas schloesseri TaxID=2026947 RepID=A0A836BBR7_9CHLO|nr:hypothetical protein HYH02_002009 [Chlamydomonas schloesseri]|eukprot:KAG2453802.1 hypothetical protein HYH02_002009 [Chlamydomonas schloesseri]
MKLRSLAIAAAALLQAFFVPTLACIFKYGSSPEGLEHSEHLGSPWGYGMGGLDWDGTDPYNNSWVCKSGHRQSPIHIHPERNYPPIPDAGRAVFDLGVLTSNSDGSNIQVINNGHTIQLEWTDPSWAPNVTIALPGPALQGPLTRAVEDTAASADGTSYTRVNVLPVQFHFHTHSEHFLHGAMYPAELHIVCRIQPGQLPGCGSKGCFTVIGVMLAIDPDDTTDHPVLAQFWDIMPLMERTVTYLPAGQRLNLTGLLPSNTSYFTYAGSLTTPPCTEGILWHLLMEPIRISYAQYEKFILATGDNMCTVTYPDARPPVRVENLTDVVRRRRSALGGDHDLYHGEHQQQQQQQQQPRDDHAAMNADHQAEHYHHAQVDHRHQEHHHHHHHHRSLRGSGLSGGASGGSQQRSLLAAAASTSAPASGNGLSNARYNCTKQGVGNNFRVIQPAWQRTILQWTQLPPAPHENLWAAARSDTAAAEGGAVAGIIIGVLAGAVCVALVALLVMTRYKHHIAGTMDSLKRVVANFSAAAVSVTTPRGGAANSRSIFSGGKPVATPEEAGYVAAHHGDDSPTGSHHPEWQQQQEQAGAGTSVGRGAGPGFTVGPAAYSSGAYGGSGYASGGYGRAPEVGLVDNRSSLEERQRMLGAPLAGSSASAR